MAAEAQASGISATSAPAISLPKGDGTIQGMSNKYAVNPINGAGSMTVPVTTSPRRSDIEQWWDTRKDTCMVEGKKACHIRREHPSIEGLVTRIER